METRQNSHLLSRNLLTTCWDCSSSSSSSCLWKASQQREGSSDFFWLSALCPEILLKEKPYNLLYLCSVEYCSSLENICFFLLVIGGLLAIWLRKTQRSRCVKVGVILSFNAQAFLTKKKNC